MTGSPVSTVAEVQHEGNRNSLRSRCAAGAWRPFSRIRPDDLNDRDVGTGNIGESALRVPFVAVADIRVLLVKHGICGNRTNWRAQLPAFSQHIACGARPQSSALRADGRVAGGQAVGLAALG